MNKVEVTCPDDCTQCPNGYTCCLNNYGRYNCCPYSNAVCCSDYAHCCPYGYNCNLPYCTKSQQETQDLSTLTPTYRSNNDIVDDFVKDEIVRIHGDIFESVICNKGTVCPSGATCCRKPSGEDACCLFQDASCCSDGMHCCPQGFTCDLQKKACIKNKIAVFPMVTKIPAKKRIPGKKVPDAKCLNTEVKNVGLKCPDGDTSCEDNSTCCKTNDNKYHCCKFPDAVCCEDGKHCCPKGFTCSAGGIIKHITL